MTQGALFPIGATVVTPTFLCFYVPTCRPRPRAELDEPIDYGGCVNVGVRCLKCGKRGTISTRKMGARDGDRESGSPAFSASRRNTEPTRTRARSRVGSIARAESR